MNTFRCVLPWLHIATQVTGKTRVCCIAGASKHFSLKKTNEALSPIETINDSQLGLNKINEILNSKHLTNLRMKMESGEVPSECRICKFNEESYGESKRITENKKWLQPGADFPNRPILKYIDLRLGNTCNLRCVMCSAKESSAWSSEVPTLLNQITNPKLKRFVSDLNKNSPSAQTENICRSSFWRILRM